MNNYVKMIRRYIGNNPLLLCGASVIIYKEKEILLQLRRDNNCWGYFGGAIEMGENVEEAAKRELYEESGLKANSLNLFNVYSGEDLHYTYPNGDEVYIVDILHYCNDFHGEILYETDETKNLKWFTIDNLPENISPPVRKPLYDFIKFLSGNKIC